MNRSGFAGARLEKVRSHLGKTTNMFSPEVRSRAVRLVHDHNMNPLSLGRQMRSCAKPQLIVGGARSPVKDMIAFVNDFARSMGRAEL